MIIALLVAGIGLLVAGLLTAAFGVQVDLSYGNTLILTGAILACTGAMILALWIVVRELKAAMGLPRVGLGSEPHAEIALPAGLAPRNKVVDDGAPTQAPAEIAGTDATGAPPAAPSWLGENEARQPAEAPAVPEPPAKPKRNLLFSSSSRKERERAQARANEPSMPDPAPAPAPPPPPSEPPPATFDDAWPKSERAKTADVVPRRSNRAGPSTFTEPAVSPPAPDRYAPPGRNEELPPVTVLKSGVVDGMAYSLYSDGSIEAQMPEGMMRFASIDELRTHLDQRP